MPGIKRFQDETAVVTGAASGIGRATAIALAEQGANLVIADIQKDRLDEVADQIRSLGRPCWPRLVDVSLRSDIEDLARFVESQAGGATILFNNAGVAMAGEVIDTSLDDFQWIMGINFWGPLVGIKAFLPAMIQRKRGHIVSTASFMGLCPTPGTAAYGATKAAVIALSEALRQEVRRHNIGVTAICPGVINTRIVESSLYHQTTGAASKESTVAFYRDKGWPPERVARAVIKAIRQNRSIVPVGPEAWAPWYIKRFSQSLYECLAQLAWRRIRGE
jgi:NAD(P)-dependent dehydrogenase (short-subunit alcohol dehydrogenase family)